MYLHLHNPGCRHDIPSDAVGYRHEMVDIAEFKARFGDGNTLRQFRDVAYSVEHAAEEEGGRTFADMLEWTCWNLDRLKPADAYPVTIQVWATQSGRPEFTIVDPTDLPVDSVARISRRLAAADDLIRIGAMSACRNRRDPPFLRAAWIPMPGSEEFLVGEPTGHDRMAARDFLRQHGLES